MMGLCFVLGSSVTPARTVGFGSRWGVCATTVAEGNVVLTGRRCRGKRQNAAASVVMCQSKGKGEGGKAGEGESETGPGLYGISKDMFGGENGILIGKSDRERLWAEIEALERYLNRVVIKSERYKEAAELRDEITAMKLRDPYVFLEMKLKKAIQASEYVEAAKLYHQMKQLGMPPKSEQNTEGKDPRKRSYPPPNASNKCECVSKGIRVQIESFLLEEASKPKDNIYVFGYKVKITNESPKTVQLIRRHWKIRTVAGEETEVKGAGVIGRQPVLQPSESFSYTSMCPMKASEKLEGKVLGSMRGTYYFVTGDVGNEGFTTEIGEFFHILP